MTESIYQQFSETELAILKARADRIAGLAQDQDDEERLTVLSVKIGDEKYALPVEQLANVYEGLPVIRVPCVPPGVAGIANIRGRVVLVLDLNILLSVPGKISDSSVLIALADDDLDLALRVDSVGDVETIPAASLSTVPSNIDLQQAGHIRGLFPNGLALLDLTAVINDSSLAVDTNA